MEENIIDYLGFSNLLDFKNDLHFFLTTKLLLDNNLEIENYPLISCLRKLSLYILEEPKNQPINQNFEELKELLTRNENIWNNNLLINLISILLYNWKNYLKLNNEYNSIMDLVRSLIKFEFLQEKLWNIENNDFFNQIFPLLLLCSDKYESNFQKFIEILERRNFGDQICIKWIQNLSNINSGSGDIYSLITNLPPQFICEYEELVKLNIIWYSTKLSFDLVGYITQISEKISNHNQIQKKITLKEIIFEWIAKEYQIMSYKINVHLDMRNYKFQLPIAELPPLEFERLILWILKEDSEWENIQWRGEAGGEKGKDLMAIKKKSKRYWIFQCKRVKLFGPADFIKEFDNVFPELIEYSCEGYILILSIKASDKLLKKIEEKEKESNILIEVWSKSELDYKIKNSKVVLNEFFK